MQASLSSPAQSWPRLLALLFGITSLSAAAVDLKSPARLGDLQNVSRYCIVLADEVTQTVSRLPADDQKLYSADLMIAGTNARSFGNYRRRAKLPEVAAGPEFESVRTAIVARIPAESRQRPMRWLSVESARCGDVVLDMMAKGL